MKPVTRRRIRIGTTALLTAGMLAGLGVGTASADPLGAQVRVSAQGPSNGDDDFDATSPAAAYSGQRNEHLMVWQGFTATEGEDEIWGRLIGADGLPVGGILRISNMGPSGNALYNGRAPEVAYNPTTDEYLVVWHGDDDSLADNEYEIWGRLIKGDGTPASAQFRISRMGADNDPDYDAFDSDVVYNSDLDQYVVVWEADDPSLGDNEYEIWGRRLSATGSSIDNDDVRISDMGPEGGASPALFGARDPKIAYDPDARQYMVVWEGDDVVDGEFEIHGQRLGQGLGPLGVNDFPISETPGALDGLDPEIAYSTVARRFMVVWEAAKVAGETEIYGEFRDANADLIGTSDMRISTSGPDGDIAFDAENPHVVANDRANEFLVSWEMDDDQPGLVVNEEEIFAQRFSGAGVTVGTLEARVSAMGPANNSGYDGLDATSAYNSADNTYLIGWRGDDNTGGLVNNEDEIYARLHGAGTATEPFPPNCKPVPARGTPNEVSVPATITAGYLKTNQRTGAATVRRGQRD